MTTQAMLIWQAFEPLQPIHKEYKWNQQAFGKRKTTLYKIGQINIYSSSSSSSLSDTVCPSPLNLSLYFFICKSWSPSNDISIFLSLLFPFPYPSKQAGPHSLSRVLQTWYSVDLTCLLIHVLNLIHPQQPFLSVDFLILTPALSTNYSR